MKQGLTSLGRQSISQQWEKPQPHSAWLHVLGAFLYFTLERAPSSWSRHSLSPGMGRKCRARPSLRAHPQNAMVNFSSWEYGAILLQGTDATRPSLLHLSSTDTGGTPMGWWGTLCTAVILTFHSGVSGIKG